MTTGEQVGSGAGFVLLGPLFGPAIHYAALPAERERQTAGSRWAACMRERGHNFGELQLTPVGERVQR